jgi:polar amino acid transport system substrate-binding protein
VPLQPTSDRSGVWSLRGRLRDAVILAASVSVAACAGSVSGLPPLPPAPHLAMHGPSIAAVQRAGVLRVASDLSYPPMEFRDGAAGRGFEMDLASLLAAALHVRLEVIDTPLPSMRAEVPRGVDMVLSALAVDQVPGLPSAPYFESGQAVLWRDGTPVRTWDDLRGRRVAVAGGSSGETVAGVGATLSAFYLPEEALAAVADGRMQAAVGDRPLLLWYAQAHPHLGITAGPQRAVPLAAGVRPDAPDLAAFVSAAIHELERNGGLAQIRRRWHL